MSKATITQCLTAIKELVLKEQQRHEEIIQKIAVLEMDLTQHKSEMLYIKKIIENSRKEIANLKSSYDSFETGFEELKATILEKTNAVLTGLEDMKPKTTLESVIFENYEDGTQLHKRSRKSK